MSIDLTVQYPGKVGTATPSWPFGEPRNITTPGDGTGTPWEAAIVKDTEALKQSLLTAAGITPSGTPDTVAVNQIMQGLVEQAMGRPVRVASSGTANDYILTPLTNQYGAASLYDGLTVEFQSLGQNTGAMTINYNGLGAVTLRDPDGLAIQAGQINNASFLRATYSGTSWTLHLARLTPFGSAPVILDTPVQIAGGTSGVAIGWTTVTQGNLTANNAQIALVELRLRMSGATAGNSVILKCAKGGTGPTFVTTQPANVRVEVNATVNAGNDNNLAFVNLDASNQLDYELQYVGAPASTATWSLQLIGWVPKWGEQDF